MRGTWQTTDNGGGAPGGLILAVIVVALAVATPVLIAVTAVIHALTIAIFAVIGLMVTGMVALVLLQRRRPPLPARRPMLHARQAREAGELRTGPRAVEAPQVHLHFHGMDADAVAAALRDATERDTR